ncbi:MAG TPA: F0F1 ATP synthase subunit epsilon [Candidatus Paceibacterota bacterium]|nr:F0F1 ATP synthase subunit epsilon [Candidatus Paceibacterota bacterium]
MADNRNTFHLIIASVGESQFDGPAVSATIPGISGVFTILPHHEPFVTTLKGGLITVRESNSESREFSVESGVVECSNNRVVVLL